MTPETLATEETERTTAQTVVGVAKLAFAAYCGVQVTRRVISAVKARRSESPVESSQAIATA